MNTAGSAAAACQSRTWDRTSPESLRPGRSRLDLGLCLQVPAAPLRPCTVSAAPPPGVKCLYSSSGSVNIWICCVTPGRYIHSFRSLVLSSFTALKTERRETSADRLELRSSSRNSSQHVRLWLFVSWVIFLLIVIKSTENHNVWYNKLCCIYTSCILFLFRSTSKQQIFTCFSNQ